MDIRDLARRWRPELAYSVRSVVAAVAALALAEALNLPLPLWAVLTAIIVTQMSVGRSLKTTIDYFIGTIGGAIYGGAVGIFLPHTSEIATLGALGLTLAPLVVIAAINSSFAAAPITGVLVLLIPGIIHASPLLSALDRVLEVTLGGAAGVIVSLVVLPSTAHRQFAEASARVLDQMAQVLDILLGPARRRLDQDARYRLQDRILQAVNQLAMVNAEAKHERMVRLPGGTETGPLLRTMVRLRHDLVMIGRAVSEPLPPEIETRLEAALVKAREAFAGYLRACAEALVKRHGPPPFDPVQSALDFLAAEVAAIRRDGLTSKLSGAVAERFFTLGFALEQMRHHISDLARCVNEWAATKASGLEAD